jgi:4-amino-4-deoxy-L-arabinose transferase-like glycosyltransferase
VRLQIVDDSRARRVVLAAVGVGLVLRLAFGLLYWNDKPLTHDEREYLALAHSLAAGRGLVYDPALETGTAQQFGRAPGYPLFLAALGAGQLNPERAPRRVQIAQAVAGAATIWLIALVAARSAGARAGAAAAVIAAVYPPLVFIPAYVFSETLYCAIAVGAALVLQRAVDALDDGPDGRRIVGAAALFGIVAGAGALVRPAMLFFLPLALLWLLKRRQAAGALVAALTFAAVLAPWTIRNIRTYDRFVLIASEGGVTFWTGNHPLARGEGDLAANPALKAADLAFRAARPGLSAEALEPFYYAEAMGWIRSSPGEWAALELRKLFYLVVPIGPSYALHSARYRIASTLPYLIVLPFAAAGAMRSGRRTPVAMLLLAGSAVIMSLVFFPQERFRIPTIDPALIVAASTLAGRPRS